MAEVKKENKEEAISLAKKTATRALEELEGTNHFKNVYIRLQKIIDDITSKKIEEARKNSDSLKNDLYADLLGDEYVKEYGHCDNGYFINNGTIEYILAKSLNEFDHKVIKNISEINENSKKIRPMSLEVPDDFYNLVSSANQPIKIAIEGVNALQSMKKDSAACVLVLYIIQCLRESSFEAYRKYLAEIIKNFNKDNKEHKELIEELLSIYEAHDIEDKKVSDVVLIRDAFAHNNIIFLNNAVTITKWDKEKKRKIYTFEMSSDKLISMAYGIQIKYSAIWLLIQFLQIISGLENKIFNHKSVKENEAINRD